MAASNSNDVFILTEQTMKFDFVENVRTKTLVLFI